jgi:hypothetical protein
MVHSSQPRPHITDGPIRQPEHSFIAMAPQALPLSTLNSGLAYHIDASHGTFNDVGGNQTNSNTYNVHNYATSGEMEVRQ